MRKTLERSVPWSPRRRATIALGAAALLVAAMATSARAAGAAGDRPAARPPTLPAVSKGDGADRVRAVDALPPGESGFVDASGAASLHVADQLSLFANWQYKPLQFQSLGGGIHPGGNPAVAVARDSYGIPRVDAADEPSLFYGVGYAMAEDRLYQMEVFRHVGHGTLASLVGSTGLGTDVLVRRLTEGADARAAEFALLPLADRQKVLGFTDGVNQAIAEANADPAHRAPVEFFVFNDFPIQPWTVDDTLAYEEFAGRFFGVFGFTELLAAQVSAQLVDALGAADAEKAFADLYPDSVPAAPVTIPPQDGTFPRHTGGPVGDGAGSPANRTVAGVPTVRELAPSVRQLADEVAAFRRAQRSLGIPGWGSNAVALSGQRTADGNPVLYGGPQVGFAGPAFFWEVELSDPQRHSRGVMVPGIPVLLIGRNQDAGWTVTSAEDANSDTFVEQLDPTDSTYVHDGVELAVEKHTETIACTDSAAGGPPCLTEPLQLTVYRSVHGPALVDPDAQHRLFVSQSAADHRFLASFAAWDRAGTQHDVRKFGAALAPIALGFNFLYAGPRGDIGYFHTGRYPIRPSNVDPNLPIPGTGPFDWQGFERYADQPHDINPASGYLVNWNNKPAVDWVSKSTSAASNAPRGWGDESHVVPLLQAAADTHQATFADVAQLPRGVAYVDSRARVLLPTLLATLRDGTDPQLRAIRVYLGQWDGRRDHVAAGGSYDTPAIVFFDRWIEHVLTDTFGPVLGPVFPAYAALACPASPCRYVSVDNLDAPTYKWELNALNALLHNLRSQGRDDFDFLGRAGGARNVLLGAAREAAAELTAAQGPDVAAWTEPAETASFQPSGAVAVPPITPLPNRGSYGQIVEPLS